jgi:hypothetical protein
MTGERNKKTEQTHCFVPQKIGNRWKTASQESDYYAMEKSDYQRKAEILYPNYDCSGDGEFAVVCWSTHTVRLFSWRMLALSEANKRCDDPHCVGQHGRVLIRPETAPVLRQPWD